MLRHTQIRRNVPVTPGDQQQLSTRSQLLIEEPEQAFLVRNMFGAFERPDEVVEDIRRAEMQNILVLDTDLFFQAGRSVVSTSLFGLYRTERTAVDPGVEMSGQQPGAASDPAAGIQDVSSRPDPGPPQQFEYQIDLSLAALFALPAVGAVMTMMHVFAPNLQPKRSGAVVEIADTAIERSHAIN